MDTRDNARDATPPPPPPGHICVLHEVTTSLFRETKEGSGAVFMRSAKEGMGGKEGLRGKEEEDRYGNVASRLEGK